MDVDGGGHGRVEFRFRESGDALRLFETSRARGLQSVYLGLLMLNPELTVVALLITTALPLEKLPSPRPCECLIVRDESQFDGSFGTYTEG